MGILPSPIRPRCEVREIHVSHRPGVPYRRRQGPKTPHTPHPTPPPGRQGMSLHQASDAGLRELIRAPTPHYAQTGANRRPRPVLTRPHAGVLNANHRSTFHSSFLFSKPTVREPATCPPGRIGARVRGRVAGGRSRNSSDRRLVRCRYRHMEDRYPEPNFSYSTRSLLGSVTFLST